LWEAAELARRGVVAGGRGREVNVARGGGGRDENVVAGHGSEANTGVDGGGREENVGQGGQPRVEMVHVVDKLVRALRMDGRECDARAAERIYASYIPERVEGVVGVEV